MAFGQVIPAKKKQTKYEFVSASTHMVMSLVVGDEIWVYNACPLSHRGSSFSGMLLDFK
jgi:hypothetical protein